MGIVIGIDVGISTTKIVGIKNGKVSAPISITAATLSHLCMVLSANICTTTKST